jgi:hypothetical protein
MRVSGLVVMSTFALALSGACSSASNSGGNNAGAGNSAATGSGGTGGGVDLDGGSGSGGTLEGCATESHTGELVPVDMFVMLDRSASMKDSGKWGSVTGAIQQFVDLPNLEKLGMGIAFFPTLPAEPAPVGPCTWPTPCGFYECVPVFGCGGAVAPNDSCVATDYQAPVVPIADLPGIATQIKTAIDAQNPEGAITPIAPALEGAIDYATQWAQAHTDRVTVVVLATDGEPTGCTPNSVNDAAAHAAEGLNSVPSVKTFVIGVGDLSALNAIAQAGGTDQVIPVSTGNAGEDFLKALDEIRGAISCQYLLPAATGGNVDPNKVNLGWTPDGSGQEVIPQVGGPGDCQGKQAWYYDNPADPKQILLCPAMCDLVSNVTGTLDVVFGCKTQVR